MKGIGPYEYEPLNFTKHVKEKFKAVKEKIEEEDLLFQEIMDNLEDNPEDNQEAILVK